MALYNRARASFEGLNQYDHLGSQLNPAEPNWTETSRTELNFYRAVATYHEYQIAKRH